MGDWDFFVTDHSEVVEQALVSANTASQTTRTMWLSFLGLMAYLIVTLAGVTHKDLLLNGAVKLPIVIVEMPLIRFFTFAPCLLVLFHFGLLMQHVTLAQKLKSFDEGVRLLGQPKSWDERTRLRLHGYSITQYVAGPKTSWIIVSGQWFMGWLTLNVIPLAVLLYFQIQFLPYHSEDLTKLHRITILADLVVLFPLGMFAEHPAHSFKEVLLHNIRQRKGFITLSISAALFVLFVSFTVATFPGEPIDEFIVDNEVWLVERSGQLMFRPTALFFEVIEVKDKDKNKDGDKDKSRSWFDRNLVVTDEDIVIDSKLEKDGPSLRLRGRNLSYAQFDYSDLHRADFTGADLRNASLYNAILEDAVLREARLQSAILQEANLQGADLQDAQLQGAVLQDAGLQGAELRRAKLQGADLFGSHLEGAILLQADLRGAILSGAWLQGAILQEAKLQGADLSRARLQGAILRDADLRGTNLRGSQFWLNGVPSINRLIPSKRKLAKLVAPDAKELDITLNNIRNVVTQNSVRKRIAWGLNTDNSKNWENSEEHDSWIKTLSWSSSDNEISTFVIALACDAELSGFVINSIARRVGLSEDPSVSDNLIAKGLLSRDCLGARALKKSLRQKLKEVSNRDGST